MLTDFGAADLPKQEDEVIKRYRSTPSAEHQDANTIALATCVLSSLKSRRQIVDRSGEEITMCTRVTHKSRGRGRELPTQSIDFQEKKPRRQGRRVVWVLLSLSNSPDSELSFWCSSSGSSIKQQEANVNEFVVHLAAPAANAGARDDRQLQIACSAVIKSDHLEWKAGRHQV